jgi:hypothetical protein
MVTSNKDRLAAEAFARSARLPITAGSRAQWLLCSATIPVLDRSLAARQLAGAGYQAGSDLHASAMAVIEARIERLARRARYLTLRGR